MADDLDSLIDSTPAAHPGGSDLDALIDATPAQTSKTGTIIHQGLQGFTQGHSDEAGGLGTAVMQGITNILPDSIRDKLDLVKADPMDAYRYSRDEERRLLAQQQAEHPTLSTVSKGAGMLAGALALPELGGEGLAGAATTGIAQGALNASGESNADLTKGEVGDYLKDVGVGGALGGAAGAAGYGVGKAIGYSAKMAGKGVSKLVNGITPSPEAAELLKEGVPLTAGQLQPGGMISRLEEAGRHSALGGEFITDAQQAAREGLQDAALNKARPIPGALGPGDMGEKLSRIMDEFGTAYEPIKNSPVQALGSVGKGALAPIDKALEAAANDQSVYATDATRSAVGKWLANATSPEQLGVGSIQPGQSAPLIKADALLKLRSAIRKQLNQAINSENYEAAGLLSKAEQSLTGGLEQQLSPDAVQALKATDAKYSLFRTLASAAKKAGDQPGGMSPTHLSNAVRQGADTLGYAMGGGGPLRDLAATGKAVLDFKQPATGAIKQTLPFGLNHIAGPVGAAMNTETGKALLMGEMGAQKALQGLAGAKPFAAMGKVGKMLRENPAALGKFGAVLSNINQQHGPEAAAAAHFVMSQSNPEYQRLASGDGEPEQP